MPTKAQIIEAIRSNPRVPAPPQIVFQILELTNREDCDVRKLAETISRDGGITAQLLREANSALYGCATATSSVAAACTRLGLKRVRAAVVNHHVVNGLTAARPRSFKPERYWQGAFAASVAAQELCRQVLPARTEDACTAGLLCDVGIGLIAMALGAQYEEILTRWGGGADRQLHEVEAAAWGVTHAEIGAEILKDWKLDAHLVEAVRHHHADPAAPIPGEHAAFAGAVAAGVVLARIALDGTDMDRIASLFAYMERLTRSPDAIVNRLLDQLVSRIQETAQMLAVDLGDLSEMQQNVAETAGSLPDLSAAMQCRPSRVAAVGP